jgi:hypothetical protein
MAMTHLRHRVLVLWLLTNYRQVSKLISRLTMLCLVCADRSFGSFSGSGTFKTASILSLEAAKGIQATNVSLYGKGSKTLVLGG